ncbi:MAG: hypothetical protein KDC34_01855 [Saprospiraceae bacterium]|nr:hypothetical protein [Saprospiraceae bacterium]
MFFRTSSLLLLLFALCACHKEARVVRYAAIAHTRLCDGTPPDTPDPRLQTLDLPDFDMRWMVGDMACNSSNKSQTLFFLDSLFDLANTNTLWAIGNHDDDDTELLGEVTERPTFYTYTRNGIVFLVLDTQLDQCRIEGKQLEMFHSVTDTIRESTHLVILHHKLIWLPEHPDLESKISKLSNADICEAPYCLFKNNFYQDLYPVLEKLSKKGVEVICLAGDIGVRAKTFEWDFNPNFHLLATGWSKISEDDQFLIFEHNLDTDELVWHFEPLSLPR